MPVPAHVPRFCAPPLWHPGGVGWEPCSLCNPVVLECREQEPGRQGCATVVPVLCQARVTAVTREPAEGRCLGCRGARGAGTPCSWEIALTGSSPSGQGAAQAGKVGMGQ